MGRLRSWRVHRPTPVVSAAIFLHSLLIAA